MKNILVLLLGFVVALHCLPARAQSTVVTYQGRLTSNGTLFTGAGQFKAALVTVTNLSSTATATANLTGTLATSYNVTFGGSGYVTPPAVTISGGGGSGATATAVISGGVVAGINPGLAGSGYTSPPTVAIAPPPNDLRYTTYWSHDGTSTAGSEPAGFVNVNAQDGLFTLALGDVAVPGMAAIPAGLFERQALHLRLWFNNGVNGFAALDPAQPLTTAPYAAVAQTVGAAGSQPLSMTINGYPVLKIETVNDPTFGLGVNSQSGYPGNIISNGVVGGFIAGGGYPTFLNRVGGDFSSVLGGVGNAANGFCSAAMGWASTAAGRAAFVVGESCLASGPYSFATGYRTEASGSSSAAFGFFSLAGGENSLAGGSSTAIGVSSTALGSAYASGSGSTALGYLTVAGGASSMAVGTRAHANHDGSFVWADGSSYSSFDSTGTNQFLIRAKGGVGVGTGNPQATVHLYDTASPTTLRLQSSAAPGAGRVEFLSDPQGSSNEWRPGYIQSTDNGGFTGGLSFVVNGTGAGSKFGEVETMRIVNGRVGIGINNPQSALQVAGTVTATAFNPASDRNLKENFQPVSPQEVLEKVAALPISRWNFKGDAATPHVGPMAQDFHAAFGLGTDDKHIATVDADGVALAAIQGLNQKLEEKLEQKQTEITELRQTVNELKELVTAMSQKLNGGAK